MPDKIVDTYCPKCDRVEGGKTLSKLIQKVNGTFKCTGMGHEFTNRIDLYAMKPRMDKLIFNEKQPPEASSIPMWIHPEALAALQVRFPNNLKTTIYSLFSALANPDTILLEATYTKELRQLGISKGREIAGLAKTNIALTEQLSQLQQQMKQYDVLAKFLSVAGGAGGGAAGIANLLAGGEAALQAPDPTERPPQATVLPTISTDSDQLYEPVAPGSFGFGSGSGAGAGMGDEAAAGSRIIQPGQTAGRPQMPKLGGR